MAQAVETAFSEAKHLIVEAGTGTGKSLAYLIPAILWAVENFEKVIIHGFDFFIDSKSHYNDNFVTKWLIDWGINKKGGKHNMMTEKIYIEKLIQDKKVIQLKEYLQS